MGHFVYIIYSQKHDVYYKGEAADVLARVADHNADRSTYTSGKGPWKLVYFEELANKTEALRREKILKRQNRRYLEWLIQQPINKLLR
jgi:putative endonuclease